MTHRCFQSQAGNECSEHVGIVFASPNTNELLLLFSFFALTFLETCGNLGLFVIFPLLREAQGKATLLYCQKQLLKEHAKGHLQIWLGRSGNEDALGHFYHSRVNCCSSQLTVATGECGHTIVRTMNFQGNLKI